MKTQRWIMNMKKEKSVTKAEHIKDNLDTLEILGLMANYMKAKVAFAKISKIVEMKIDMQEKWRKGIKND